MLIRLEMVRPDQFFGTTPNKYVPWWFDSFSRPHVRLNFNKTKEVVYVAAKRKPLGRKGKNSVFINGYTSDGIPVLCNVFYQFETNGVPLDIMIETFYNSGYIIDWCSFVNDAFNIGWKKDTIIKKIKYAFDDIEIDNSDSILERIVQYVERQGKRDE